MQKTMQTHVNWNQKSDSLLKYFYEDLKIYNWNTIARELSERVGQEYIPDGCRNRYSISYGPVKRDEWTPEQQNQLYRLHDQNGNKWAVIAYNLLGRSDNCVKNHFYSKLRKSLRTLNKIGKMYLKKSVKQVSNTVLYKLTQATDQSLKQNPEISKQLVELCYDLKNRLLNYDMDQKNIRDQYDYQFEKSLLLDLTAFSKNYKKKSKKEKNSVMGSQNLKKLHQKKRRERQLKIIGHHIFHSEGSDENFSDRHSDNNVSRNLVRVSRAESQVSSLVPKMMVNFVITAPTKEQKQNNQSKVQINNIVQLTSPKILQQNIKVQPIQPHSNPIPNLNTNVIICPITNPILSSNINPTPDLPPTVKPAINPNVQTVQNILKAQGILEYGVNRQNNENDEASSFFRRESSNRSFSSVRSVMSESSYPDMFGEDFMMNSRFKDISQMEEDNHIFGHESNSMNHH